MLSDVAEQFQLLAEINRPDFELDTSESCLHLLFNPAVHLFEISHPDQSVDGNSLFTSGKWSVPERQTASFEVVYCRFQSEQDGGVGTQCLIVNFSRSLECFAAVMQENFILGQVVTAQTGQWSTFPDPVASGTWVFHPYVPDVACRIDTS